MDNLHKPNSKDFKALVSLLREMGCEEVKNGVKITSKCSNASSKLDSLTLRAGFLFYGNERSNPKEIAKKIREISKNSWIFTEKERQRLVDISDLIEQL